MDKNEEYVRSVWASVSYCSREETNSCCGPSVFIVPFTGKWVGEFRAETKSRVFELAAEFTREHKEKVRQLRRQVSLMKDGLTDWAVEILLSEVGGEISPDLMNAEYVRDECTGYFVLALLEAELTRLTAGMKPEAL